MAAQERKPTVIVLAGPNGAGKTTAARTLLGELLQVRPFVNADVIAQGLAGFDPESVAVQAGRIMLERMDELAAQPADFAFETTLAARSYARRLRSMQRDLGYLVQLFYVWSPSPDLSVVRVAARVRDGGHHIPEDTIRQRWRKSLEYLLGLYLPIADAYDVYVNIDAYRLVARRKAGSEPEVIDPEFWGRMRSEAGL